MQTNKTLLNIEIIVSVIIFISLYNIHLISPKVTSLYGSIGVHYFLYSQFIAVAIFIIIYILLKKLDYSKWFNKIGFSLFVIPFMAIILIQYVPSNMISLSRGSMSYIDIFGFNFNPFIFYSIGFVFIIDYIYNKFSNLKLANVSSIFILLLTSLWFIYSRNYSDLSVLYFVFFAMFIYNNNHSKILPYFVFGNISVVIYFLVSSPYRLNRIISWWNDGYNLDWQNNPDTFLHSNLLNSLNSNLGIFFFVIVIILFIFLVYKLFVLKKNSSNPTFIIGIASLVFVPMLFNILFTLNLFPIYQPSIYFFGYGFNIILSSAIIIIMMNMIIKYNNQGKQ